MTKDEINALQKYLTNLFRQDIRVKQRHKIKDSAEVFIKDNFIGLVYKDEDDNDGSYSLSISILEEDLREDLAE